jgi:hypothetical protein
MSWFYGLNFGAASSQHKPQNEKQGKAARGLSQLVSILTQTSPLSPFPGWRSLLQWTKAISISRGERKHIAGSGSITEKWASAIWPHPSL